MKVSNTNQTSNQSGFLKSKLYFRPLPLYPKSLHRDSPVSTNTSVSRSRPHHLANPRKTGCSFHGFPNQTAFTHSRRTVCYIIYFLFWYCINLAVFWNFRYTDIIRHRFASHVVQRALERGFDIVEKEVRYSAYLLCIFKSRFCTCSWHEMPGWKKPWMKSHHFNPSFFPSFQYV